MTRVHTLNQLQTNMAAQPEDCVQGNDLDLILDLLDDDFFEDEESLQSELDMIVSEVSFYPRTFAFSRKKVIVCR